MFTDTRHQVLIREKGKDEVIRDENVIVIGCSELFASDAKASAQKFNRSNTEYKVEVKTYNLNEDGYYSFYEELLRGDGPDIVDVSWLPKDMLAAKGVWEESVSVQEVSSILYEELALSFWGTSRRKRQRKSYKTESRSTLRNRTLYMELVKMSPKGKFKPLPPRTVSS